MQKYSFLCLLQSNFCNFIKLLRQKIWNDFQNDRSCLVVFGHFLPFHRCFLLFMHAGSLYALFYYDCF